RLCDVHRTEPGARRFERSDAGEEPRRREVPVEKGLSQRRVAGGQPRPGGELHLSAHSPCGGYGSAGRASLDSQCALQQVLRIAAAGSRRQPLGSLAGIALADVRRGLDHGAAETPLDAPGEQEALDRLTGTGELIGTLATQS